MTDTPITDAIRALPPADLTAIKVTAHRLVNEDPDNARPMTVFWYAVYCAIVDVEAERQAEVDKLNRDYHDDGEQDT